MLDGVPFGVKDDLSVKGYKRYIGTTHDYSEGGTKETSWCVKKVEEEGAILVGTLTMHELGMGKSTNPGTLSQPSSRWNEIGMETGT